MSDKLKLGFTGTRQGLTSQQHEVVRNLLYYYRVTADEFHHGDCVGADIQAALMAKRYYNIHTHPPKSSYCRARYPYEHKEYPVKSFLARNQAIVEATDLLIACPVNHASRTRSGTGWTIDYARSRDKAVYIILPSGNTSVLAPSDEEIDLMYTVLKLC